MKEVTETQHDYNLNYESGGTGPALSNIFQTDQGLNILATDPNIEKTLSIGSSRRIVNTKFG